MLFGPLQSAPADKLALAFPDASLTYGELRGAAHAVAARLGGADGVAVLAEPRIETCVAVLGALLAGVPAVPLNPKSGAAELTHVIGDADPSALLLAKGARAPEAFAGRDTIEIDIAARDEDDPPRAELADRPDTAALIVYTSGTTGRPKGAVIPRRAIATNLDALAQIWAWTAEDVVTHGLPLFHVHGLVVGILGPIRRGGTALHLGRFSPDAVQGAFTAAGGRPPATILFGVPTMYRRLADAAERSPELAAALRQARLLVSGSAALPAAEHDRLRRITGRTVVERYGMTETLLSTGVPADAAPAPGTVGPPLPGVEVRLADDDGELVTAADDETIGEIQVRGPNVFLGYLNRPAETAEALRDGWFHTGDMATRTPAGFIRIVGRRATDLIKSGGHKIGAGEIEGVLRQHPAVADAAVTGEPDDDLGERVIAWVVLGDGAGAAESELIDHVAGQLAPHKRPRVVRFLDELPRNELGKVQKQRLVSP